jgi:ribosomal protein L31
MQTGIHGQYFTDVEVVCMCGTSYTLAAAIKGPIKLENCPACHAAFNKGAVIVKESKGMRQKYEEKMAKMAAVQAKQAA